ncbi:MAG: PIG-L family deacetylase [Bryobacterales bacterium]|nr:PIG-L family deacetylase [Bryobacteraceae bacterium]MDW8354288.1 PIG-L family deacetylase [Bryobacterales bacterium]
MQRREFLQVAAAGQWTALAPSLAQPPASEVYIERAAEGRPHAGKVLAAIQPHSDDIPLFAAGTVAKLLDEGYTGYLIRVTNDDMAGPGTIGETVLANERDNDEVARVLGMKGVFNLNYSNHQMDGESRLEIRARFIFLFRLLKVDTIVCYDPWGHYEENPDHYVTAHCVEAACWMAGMDKDYPEHFAAGLTPHAVKEKYYFARGPQLVNRIVDISTTIEKKIDVNLVNRAQGPAGENGARLRARLAAQGLRLPLLGNDDHTANREYIRHFVLARDAELGRRYGLAYAEKFHYIGPEPSPVEEYVRKHAVPL